MDTMTSGRTSVRDRLLAAADELFYGEGVHSVGIDRVIERAGVAKASLYNTFGSKDELVRAYLAARHERTVERTMRKLAKYETPRDRILAMFDLVGESSTQPGFRGCAYVNASAESPAGGVVEEVSDIYRAWGRTLFADLAREAGAKDPETLGQQLMLLRDGALVSARMDRDPGAAAAARTVATALLDAATV